MSQMLSSKSRDQKMKNSQKAGNNTQHSNRPIKGLKAPVPPVHTQREVVRGGVTRTKKAGLQFSVARCGKFLKRGRYAARLGAGAPVYLAAVGEYLIAEIMELAGDMTKEKGGKRIMPRELTLAIKEDEELNKLFGEHTVFHQGGDVVKGVPFQLLSKPQQKAMIKQGADLAQNY